MNQTKQVFIILIIFLSIWVKAQDTLRINFDPEYHLVDDGLSFMELIENHSAHIEHNGEKYQITYPSDFIVQDTAIAFNYFTGWTKPAIENTTVLLFGNHTTKSPLVYVDYNHNLDFSDDGQPLLFRPDSTLVVYLHRPENDSALFPIKFFFPKMSAEQIEQLKTFFEPSLMGNGTLNSIPLEYWPGEHRMNIKLSDTHLKGIPLKIGLIDWDCNGLYNDEGHDRISIGSYPENSISFEVEKGAIEYKRNVQIKIGEEIFQVIDIEPTGRYIDIVKSNRTFQKPIDKGDYIGDLEIKLISGKTHTLDQLKKENKYTLLDLWGTWCKGCIQSLPDLKRLANEKSNTLQIIGVNFDNEISDVITFINKKELPWLNGIANEELIKLLRVYSAPRYILLSPENKIVLFDGRLSEIESHL